MLDADSFTTHRPAPSATVVGAENEDNNFPTSLIRTTKHTQPSGKSRQFSNKNKSNNNNNNNNTRRQQANQLLHPHPTPSKSTNQPHKHKYQPHTKQNPILVMFSNEQQQTSSILFSKPKPFRTTSSSRCSICIPSTLLLLLISSFLVIISPDSRNSMLVAVQAISIKPADFDRLIMPCYQGGSGGGGSSLNYQPQQQQVSFSQPMPPTPNAVPLNSASYSGNGGGGQQFGRQQFGGTNNNNNGAQPSPAYYAIGGAESAAAARSGQLASTSTFLGSANSMGAGQRSAMMGSQLDGGSNYQNNNNNNNYLSSNSYGGQAPIARANTIDNFISLVSKIEASNPRLANNVDQLILSLLGRFRMDNYYYDVRSRTPISDQDKRVSDIIPALFASMSLQNNQQPQYVNNGDLFPEQVLDMNEKCSMYFMLSHFIDKTSPSSPALGQLPIIQLSGPQMGQRAPGLQAAGAGYPAQSANLAYGGTGARYPGPAPSFGSPATNGMSSFGSGINNQPDYLNNNNNNKNPFGVNTAQPLNQFNQQPGGGYPRPGSGGGGGQLMSAGTFGAPPRSQVAPYIDAASGRQAGSPMQQQQHRLTANGQDDRMALEFGVVGLANQIDAALVLNRVLLGLLGATMPAQTIRQLASIVYPQSQQVMLQTTPKIDDELDPLYALTLADLWAISSIPKAGKPFDIRMLGDNGHWNDTMCPTTFTLERAHSIRFTTAELLGGIDGFNLGLLRRRLISNNQMQPQQQQRGASNNKQMRLSEMLRMYYSRSGFRPQFGEVGVCNRQSALNTNMDDLHRQAETYLRLYQLNLPITDNEISLSINRLVGFRETVRQVAQQFTPQDLCQESGAQLASAGFDNGNSLYPTGALDQCEIPKADLVSVLDASQQANDEFMHLVVVKLAQRLGLSRLGSSLTILTNQQDTSGASVGAGGGALGLNVIVRNSTNTAEIGCALAHDTSQSYQGGQITEPTRLMEAFERALVNLDSEYLSRQMGEAYGASSSSSFASSSRPTYVSSWFGDAAGGGYSANYMQSANGAGGPRNTGGAKVIIWFNYGPQARPVQLASSQMSSGWNSPLSGGGGGSQSDQQQQLSYKFYEAKKYLRENFRSASILAVAPNRDDVKSFVYDDERDIFADIPPGTNLANTNLQSSSADYYPSSAPDPQSLAMLNGPAEQLVGKLMQRICTIPAVFQYPMCFRLASRDVHSVGYISPGRRQYWLMAPKTFFASTSIRLVFKVEGGRLRVCFGRKPNPDESAQRNPQNNQQLGAGAGGSSGISLFNNQQQQQQQSSSASSTEAPQPSSGDYYTGREYGVCKELAPGQEIDFLIADPCYRRSIAECEPFYFVIRETSQPGEGDPNYMCRDDGCKRLDQAKFVMSHTGISCSSATRSAHANQLLIILGALIVATIFVKQTSVIEATTTTKMAETIDGRDEEHKSRRRPRPPPSTNQQNINRSLATAAAAAAAACSGARCRSWPALISVGVVGLIALVAQVAHGQQANVYDYGQNRYGEKRGSYTPPEVLAILLVIMMIIAGLALTIGLCYYVAKRNREGLQPVNQNEDEY